MYVYGTVIRKLYILWEKTSETAKAAVGVDFKVDLEEGSGGGGGDGEAGWVESRTILGQVCFIYNLYVTVIFVYTYTKDLYI